MFLASFGDDPEEQRFSKAVVHLRTLVFGRLSDDHVVALALLHELGGLYRRAFGTDQVLHPAQRGSQEEALRAHLRALGLPDQLTELEPCEIEQLIELWEPHLGRLPRPFAETLRAFVQHSKTHLVRSSAPLLNQR